jgi:hypothetical protein
MALISALWLTGPAFGAQGQSTTKLVLVGKEKVDKGWGSSTESVLEELWSYLIHGHGRRESRGVYREVPVTIDGPTDGIIPSDGTQPGDGGTQPGDGGTQPGDGGTQPGDDGTQPGDGGTQPGDGGTQPGDGGTQPGDDTNGKADVPGDDLPDGDNGGGGVDIGGDPTPGTAPVPEPGTLMALLAGAAGTLLMRRRRQQA